MVASLIGCTDDAPTGDEATAVTRTSTTPSARADATAQVRVSFEQIADAMAAGDGARLGELSTGPAGAFFSRVRHFAAATGSDEPYPDLRAEAGNITELDNGDVRVDGTILFGVDAASSRRMTNLAFVAHDGQWLLDRFDRDGIPIGQWIAPMTTVPAVSGPVTVELRSLFADLTCAPDAASDCPDNYRDTVSVDLLVTNDSDDPLSAGALTTPDGIETAAWLETPSGGEHPLVDAAVNGFPPHATAPVIGLFAAASDLSDGAVLHIVLLTADGESHSFDLDVAPFPHDWSTP